MACGLPPVTGLSTKATSRSKSRLAIRALSCGRDVPQSISIIPLRRCASISAITRSTTSELGRHRITTSLASTSAARLAAFACPSGAQGFDRGAVAVCDDRHRMPRINEMTSHMLAHDPCADEANPFQSCGHGPCLLIRQCDAS
jgi:hypothetical protein